MGKISFGTGGFRAVIGESFTKENVQLICQAISNIILREGKEREVCIGYDNRFMSEIYAIWCSEVFAGNGILVELFDSATATPVAMYASKLNGNDFGIMVTASHNPYIYNGIKVFVKDGKDAGVDITSLIENEIAHIKEIKSIDYKEGLTKNITLANYVESYVNNIITVLNLQPTNNLNVVFEAKHGSTVSAIHLFAKKIGLTNYQIINDNRDAFFSFKTPAPNQDNLQELKDAVSSRNADIGFALDADGDRLAVIDEKGNYIDNNFILAIAYYFLVKYCGKRGDSVKNVATSNLLDKVTENLGFNCIEVPVGFKYVSSAIINTNAIVGGESSGGLAINGHIWGKDSMLAIAICLKAMSTMNKSFKEILQEVLQFAGDYKKVIQDRQYTFSAQQKQFIDDVLFKQHKLPAHRFEVEKIVFENYIKVYYKNGNWSLIRFSGTEPIIRIFAEGDSLEEANDIIDDLQEFLGLQQ